MKVISYQLVKPRDGGPYSLFCYNCRRWIPNTANHEMQKEGVYAHGHTCAKFSDGSVMVLLEDGIPEGDEAGYTLYALGKHTHRYI